MNKKGTIGETINLGLATIIIFVLAIVFLLLSSLAKGGISGSLNEESKNLILKQEAEQSLIAYLKTSVQIERNNINQDITMADLIRLAKNEEVYEDLLKSKSMEIFDLIYDEYSLSAGLIGIKSTSEDIVSAAEKIAYIDIPLNSNGEKIRVILMIK